MRKKIYVAILTQGEVRHELSAVIHDLPWQGKYDVQVFYPYDKPISNNRNKIVQDFLSKKEFDYLLMIDDDIVPPHNILNLADFKKDIVSGLCFIWQQNMVAPLTLKDNGEGTYGVAHFKGFEGLVEIDAVGTGCLMLSRKVLEEVKAPFADIFDADGIRQYGLDIAFCRRAKEKGYKVYCHLDYPCNHFVTMDLLKIYQSIVKK